MDFLRVSSYQQPVVLNLSSYSPLLHCSTQIRQTLTKQVFEEAGIRVQQVSAQSTNKITVSSGFQKQQAAAIAGTPTTVLHANNGTPVVIQPQSPVATSNVVAGQHLIHQSSPTSSAEVMMTLNRLNAEVDTEDQLNAADLEFDVETEVTTG